MSELMLWVCNFADFSTSGSGRRSTISLPRLPRNVMATAFEVACECADEDYRAVLCVSNSALVYDFARVRREVCVSVDFSIQH